MTAQAADSSTPITQNPKRVFWRNNSSANTAAPISTHKAGQREKVIAAHAGYNTEGDTVKNNDMPDKKPHYHKDKANYKTDY